MLCGLRGKHSVWRSEMSRFEKKFLREGEGIFQRKTKATIYLGAYGKHPGWDDHIDDIGLETESLVLAKQILYVDGIGGQIDSGEWDKLDTNKLLPEFKHIFVWKRGDAYLLGRIWSSRDGKDRTKYPMIVCAHCLNVPLAWAFTHVWPALEEVERLCKITDSAAEVREILQRTLAGLRQSLGTAPVLREEFKPAAFISRLGLSDAQEKLFRIAYQVSSKPSGQIRLPAVSGLVQETLTFWSQFLESQFGTDIPILLAMPLLEGWLDAACEEPTVREFFCLRATPAILAIASEVPYEIDDEFRKTHQGAIQALMAA